MPKKTTPSGAFHFLLTADIFTTVLNKCIKIKLSPKKIQTSQKFPQTSPIRGFTANKHEETTIGVCIFHARQHRCGNILFGDIIPGKFSFLFVRKDHECLMREFMPRDNHYKYLK